MTASKARGARVNVRGMVCSDAVVLVHKTIGRMAPGAVLGVVADDQAVVDDLERYAARGGHEWLGTRREGRAIHAEVRRGE